MAKNNNLGDFLTDIANAIRTKTGSSTTINAQDFATEITNIPTTSASVDIRVARIIRKTYASTSSTLTYTKSTTTHPKLIIGAQNKCSNTVYQSMIPYTILNKDGSNYDPSSRYGWYIYNTYTGVLTIYEFNGTIRETFNVDTLIIKGSSSTSWSMVCLEIWLNDYPSYKESRNGELNYGFSQSNSSYVTGTTGASTDKYLTKYLDIWVSSIMTTSTSYTVNMRCSQLGITEGSNYYNAFVVNDWYLTLINGNSTTIAVADVTDENLDIRYQAVDTSSYGVGSISYRQFRLYLGTLGSNTH